MSNNEEAWLMRWQYQMSSGREKAAPETAAYGVIENGVRLEGSAWWRLARRRESITAKAESAARKENSAAAEGVVWPC
jgi:hypothetical protein